MRTEELINALAKNAEPVGRLWHPAARAIAWMMGSVLYVAAFVWLIGPRADLSDKLVDPRFLIEVGAALLTSMMAAAAAFCAGCPGRPLWERFAPFPFLAVWLASLGEGCWRQWIQSGPDGLALQVDLTCFQNIVAVSILPAVAIFLMIRQGAPIAPMSTTGLATLAATALGAAALRLFHTQDMSLMLLVWQFGTVSLLAGLGFLTGRKFLRWSLPQVDITAGTRSPPN
jgi:hypothetical protein